MIRAVLKKAGHKSFSVSEPCKKSSRGKDEIDLIMEAADIRSLRIFAFFRGITAMPCSSVHWAVFEESVNSKKVGFPKKVSE
jgi:hypothetical protein